MTGFRLAYPGNVSSLLVSGAARQSGACRSLGFQGDAPLAAWRKRARQSRRTHVLV